MSKKTQTICKHCNLVIADKGAYGWRDKKGSGKCPGQAHEPAPPASTPEKKIAEIKCDRIAYMLPQCGHSGSDLRAFFAVPNDKDLYLQMEEGDDFLVEDSDKQYLVENRDKFYTVSRKIIGG